MRTRFAPSPTGFLHIGHALAAKEAFDFAETKGGQCLLRIEDTDHTRCKEEFTKSIYADLDWLGFDWPLPVRVQSHYYPDYAKPVSELIARGLAYPCELTRKDIKEGERPHPDNMEDKNGSVIKAELLKSTQHDRPSLPFALRLNLPKALETIGPLGFEDIGPIHEGIHDAREFFDQNDLDPVIARKDIGCSYMIAGPHDDWKQEISHVVRGADLFHETPLQVLIQALMGWPTPIYYHHGLVMNEAGEKLSKRNLDTALQSLREAGQTPEDIWDMTRAYSK